MSSNNSNRSKSGEPPPIGKDPHVRRIVAVGGGKGGVGTSLMVTNLGVFLAQIGRRVVIVDANLADSGLCGCLGVSRPERTIADVLLGRVGSIREAIVDTPVAGLSLIAGAENLLGSWGLADEARHSLAGQIRSIEADFVLIDLPSGLDPLALDLFGEADMSIAVTLATPDSVEATYRFFVAAFMVRLFRSSHMDRASQDILGELGSRKGPPPTIREIVDELKNTAAAEEAVRLSTTFHPQLIVNQLRVKVDETLGEAMVAASTRWLGLIPRLLGSVEWDDNAWLSLRRGKPLLVDFPQSRACRGLERVVRRILSQDFSELFEPITIPPATEKQNHYELLEIHPGASEEEVRRGLKRIRDFFGTEGMAVSGVCSTDECSAYQTSAEEAHATLVDKSKKRQYDRGTFPDGFPSMGDTLSQGRAFMAERVMSPHDSLPKVEVRDDQMVDGEFLGSIRKQRNIQLEDISNRAKISISYLKAIEQESFEDLPTAVYVRGFVTEFARYLKIDSKRAASDFMAKYDDWHQKKKK